MLSKSTAPVAAESGMSTDRDARADLHPRTMVFAVVGGLVLIVATSLLLLTGGSGPEDVARAAITGLAGRKANTAERLVKPRDLARFADDLGYAILPASASVTIEDLELRRLESSTGDEASVIAQWTAVLNGQDLETIRTQQTVTVALAKDAADGWQILSMNAPVAVELDLSTYFDGETKADRDQFVADLVNGTAWLGVIEVNPTDRREAVLVEPKYSEDPDMWSWDEKVIREGRDGEITHYGIDVTGPYGLLVDFTVASVETIAAEPASIVRGTLTEEGVTTAASDALRDFSIALGDDPDAARDMLTDPAAVTESALARMAKRPPHAGQLALVEQSDPVRVVVGDFVLERLPGGTWKINPDRSVMLVDFVPGEGEDVVVSNGRAMVDFSDCDDRATITFTFEGVAFYSDDRAVAEFTTSAIGDLSCANGVTFDRADVSWPGGNGRGKVVGESDGGGSLIEVILPDQAKRPITLEVEVRTIDSFGWDRRQGDAAKITIGD